MYYDHTTSTYYDHSTCVCYDHNTCMYYDHNTCMYYGHSTCTDYGQNACIMSYTARFPRHGCREGLGGEPPQVSRGGLRARGLPQRRALLPIGGG